MGLLCLLLQPPPMLLALPHTLPEIGRSTGLSLSFEQERLCGELTIRKLRGQQQLLTDPLLDNYLAELGQRLRLQATSLQYPLQFYWRPQSEINAFALVGGYLVVHTSLLSITDEEDELAAVLAHEIAHVSQRHIARRVAAQQQTQPIALAASLGSAILMLANPVAGMAALSLTLSGMAQQALVYSQAHEMEADRVGMTLLGRAGFDPRAMANFLGKLANTAGQGLPVPEILLTHPLPQRRLAEAREKTLQLLPRRIKSSSLDYFFAKIRCQQLYTVNQLAIQSRSTDNTLLSFPRLESSAQALLQGYCQALQHYQQQQFKQGQQQLQRLLKDYPVNVWLLDAITDMELAQREYCSAIQRLQQALQRLPEHPVLLLNLANAYLHQGDNAAAVALLRPYCRHYPNSISGWRLLTQAYAAKRSLAEEQAAQAEQFALWGDFKQAQQALQRAQHNAIKQPLQRMRYQARLEQLRHYEWILQQAEKL